MITIQNIKIEKQRLHVVEPVEVIKMVRYTSFGATLFLANCQSVLTLTRSASANKTPYSETEDKKKMTE